MNTLVAIRMARISGAMMTVLALAPAPSSAGGDRHHPPAHITIHGPNAGNFQGLTTTTGWSLMLRIEVPDSVAILESPEEPTMPVGRREAIVYDDPDGCIDMRHFPIINAGTPYEDCSGPDESFIEFTTERFDNFDVADSNTGNFQVRDILVDDVFAPGALLNKPFLRNTAGSIVAVPRPQTGVDADRTGLVTVRTTISPGSSLWPTSVRHARSTRTSTRRRAKSSATWVDSSTASRRSC